MSSENGATAGDPAARARRSPWRVAAYAAAVVVAVIAATLLVAFAGTDFGIPDAATEDGRRVVTVWRMLVVMATAVAIIVLILLGIALVSGARRTTASQTKGSVPLEVAYTAAPLALVAVIFGASGWLGYRISDATGGDAVEIQTDAFRWGWRFTYPTGRQVVSSSDRGEATIVLPVDRVIEFQLHSEDVIHSFFVPSFVTKLDVIPGHDQELRVHTVEVGEYRGHCAEYCGLDHARMNFRVEVVESERFESWLATGELAP